LENVCHVNRNIFTHRSSFAPSLLRGCSVNKPTPFDHDGHQAFGAHVYSADEGQHLWVGYLEQSGNTFTAEVKEPGKGHWVPMMSQAGMKVITVKATAAMGTQPVTEMWP
jgi:hypothetical protein